MNTTNDKNRGKKQTNKRKIEKLKYKSTHEKVRIVFVYSDNNVFCIYQSSREGGRFRKGFCSFLYISTMTTCKKLLGFMKVIYFLKERKIIIFHNHQHRRRPNLAAESCFLIMQETLTSLLHVFS